VADRAGRRAPLAHALAALFAFMTAPRFFIDLPIRQGAGFGLPAGPARHVQVLRLQPGAPVVLFDGHGGEWDADVTQMGRKDVEVEVHAHRAVDRELSTHVTLAIGMPANERMDTLVEKATELGVAAIQPLVCARSVLRLTGERADKKVAHWQGVAIAASEQCGRTRVPEIAPVASLGDWLARLPADGDGAARWVLSLREARAFGGLPASSSVVTLSGPEGGLTEAEEDAARARAFSAISLGARVLRADTAPLAVLAGLALRDGG
jgi:16S rRNA (uracil1498-N3)-methyltransferase